MSEAWIAGVDGCPAGWIAVFGPADAPGDWEMRVFAAFADLLAHVPDRAVVAVDMPIGLPERAGPGGRGPEGALRPWLGQRKSSVFSIPSRRAVYASDYRQACAEALATSDPPRMVSKQGFFLFPKIREIDALMRADAALAARVFECHPEGVFRMLAGAPLEQPKKIKGRVNAAGMAQRRALLRAFGFADALLDAKSPRGAARDDCLDACAAAAGARRIARGEAIRHPAQPGCDAHGLPIAIWT